MDLLRKGRDEEKNIKSHLHSLHKLLEFAFSPRIIALSHVISQILHALAGLRHFSAARESQRPPNAKRLTPPEPLKAKGLPSEREQRRKSRIPPTQLPFLTSSFLSPGE